MIYKSKWFVQTLIIVLVIIIALLYTRIPLNASKFLIILSFFTFILLSLKSPEISLTIFLIYFVFERRVDIFSNLTISTTEIGLISIIFGLMFKSRRQVLKRYRLFIPLLAFTIWIIFVSIISFNSIATLKQGIRYIEGFLTFFALYFFIDKVNKQWIFRIFLPLSLIISMIGILQVVSPIFRNIFPPPPYNEPAVLLHNLVRTYSTFDHPNYLGVFLIPPLLISLGVFLSTKSRRFICLIGIIIIAIAVILSLSRGAWIVISIFSILMFCIIIIKRKLIISNLLILLTIIIILIISFVFIPIVWSNLESRISIIKVNQQHYMDLQRLYNFKIGFKMLLEKPITGWGSYSEKQNDIEYISKKFYIVDFVKNRWGWANNLYLQVAVDFGIVGLILFLIVLIQSIIISRKGLYEMGLLFYIIFISFIALLFRGLMETIIARSLFIYTNIILALSSKIERND
ncbi:MAG: O-antigen ligase family protein [bacterium]